MTMAKDIAALTAANRAAWDSSAPLHRQAASWRAVLDGFRQPGWSCLDPVETALLRGLAPAGKAVAQVCCNNGRELISISRMGTARAVGFDRSVAFLVQARELAAVAAAQVEFVATNAYDLPGDHAGAFDLVVITIGVLGWMPDLPGFLARVAALLAPGAALFVYEQHPIMNMMEPSSAAPPDRLMHSYFREEPFIDHSAIVYEDGPRPEAPTHYWFPYMLSGVLQGVIAAGLAIEHIQEYPHNISGAKFDRFNR